MAGWVWKWQVGAHFHQTQVCPSPLVANLAEKHEQKCLNLSKEKERESSRIFLKDKAANSQGSFADDDLDQ